MTENSFFIGTPVMTHYLYEKGIETALDAMKEMSGVNAVMPYFASYQLHQYSGYRREAGTDRIVSSRYVSFRDEAFEGTCIKHPDCEGHLYADRDILDEIAEAAASRGMDVYTRHLEPYVITGIIPGLDQCREVDAEGRELDTVCFNHPDYREWLRATVSDLVATHPQVKGYKYGQERGGPINRSFGGDAAACFCEHCSRKAADAGLDVEAARAAMLALRDFACECREDAPPEDGYLTTFFRLLYRHPALLQWDDFYMESRQDHRRLAHAAIKAVRPEVQVGWHIDHGMSWDIFKRAQSEYARMTPYSDWLSIAVYFDCMAPRSKGHFDRNYGGLLLRDLPVQLGWPAYLHLLGLQPEKEPSYEQIEAGHICVSEDYVYRETRRAVSGVDGGCRIYPRIGFDVGLYDSKATPAQVKASVGAALDGGADGLFVAREWHEITEENARAFGDALRERGAL